MTRTKLVQPDFGIFFERLSYRLTLLAAARAQTDKFLSTRFNIFEFVDPTENGLSDIIKWLLDPNGGHGQEDRFLKAFLEVVCDRKSVDTSNCLVKREDLTAFIESDRRRMDIMIEFNGFAIAIENKPWAVEGHEQIGDYVEHPFGKQQLKSITYCGKFKQWLETKLK